jgi:hypothetical protein
MHMLHLAAARNEEEALPTVRTIARIGNAKRSEGECWDGVRAGGSHGSRLGFRRRQSGRKRR